MAVRRRGSGWEFVFDNGRGAQGKRKQIRRSGFRTKREAEEAERKARYEQDQGLDVAPERLTLGAYLDHWLRAYAQTHVAASTYQRYRELLTIHVTPALGHIQLKKLRPLEIENCYGAVLRAGRSPRTALHVHRVLNQALGQAVRWQLLARNVADAVEPPRPDKPVVKVPRVEELQRLLDLADKTRYGTIFRLALMTGLRQGELLALCWQNVDLDARVLYVVQSVRRLKGQGFVFSRPKTQRSSRSVALSSETVELLRAHRRKQAEEMMRERLDYEDQNLVFANALGQVLDGYNVSKTWRTVVAGAGLPPIRFHDLRHAHATLMLLAGVHPKVVQERLGHSTISTTLDIYSHVVSNLQAEAAATLDGLLAAKRVSNQ